MKDLIISDIVKEYPDMLKIVIYHNNYTLPDPEQRKRQKESKKEDNVHRSVRRTKTTIHDIILTNKFDLWCTFTFDRKKIDRYNVDRCKTSMTLWLHNQKKRNSPNLLYLIVPEFHKDGAIHFHALLKNYKGYLTPTTKKINKKPVYNIQPYTLGYSTAIAINAYDPNAHSQKTDPRTDHTALANYMTKYITKDMPLIHGRKRYFVSREIARPTTYVNGISRLHLSHIIQRHTPSYINDYLEVQHHKKLTKLATGRDHSLFS